MNNDLKPLIEQVKKTWEQREEIQKELVQNVKTKSAELEAKAWEFARTSKDHQVVTQYLRPFISSSQTDKALESLTRLKSPWADKVHNKLNEVRKQFLEVTAPREVEAEVVIQKESTPTADVEKKTRRSKKTDTDENPS